MAISISSLKEDIYELFGRILQTGTPLEVERHGRKLLIAPARDSDRLKNLRKRSVMNCEPEDLVHMNWLDEQKPSM